MNQYKTSSELKNIAREKLSGKYGSAMLVSPVIQCALAMAVSIPVVIMLMIPFALTALVNNADTNILVGTLVIYLVMLPLASLFGVLNTGVSLFYLNIACGRKHSVANLFYGFRTQFTKSLKLSAVVTLISYVCMLPYQIFNCLHSINSQTVWVICMAVSYIVCILVYLPIQLALSQCFYLLLDFPDYSVKELLKLSVQVMKGHKKRLFYIQLSFIPIQFLCILSCYVGYLWVIPYMNMTNVLFFLDIMKQQTPTASYDSCTD